MVLADCGSDKLRELWTLALDAVSRLDKLATVGGELGA
jgi:hypothetical protein